MNLISLFLFIKRMIKIIHIFILFRWVPTLTSDQVADRIISAIQKREKIAVIPRYLQIMLCIKW